MAYNGYPNYQTWNVALWLDNDPYTEEAQRNLAQLADDKADLSVLLRDFVETMPEISPVIGGSSMAADLLGHALQSVDWYHLASNLWDEERKS